MITRVCCLLRVHLYIAVGLTGYTINNKEHKSFDQFVCLINLTLTFFNPMIHSIPVVYTFDAIKNQIQRFLILT